MNSEVFINLMQQEVHYLSFEVNKPIANVVISHGMGEHPARYAPLAAFLNANSINVYAIYHIGHGEFAEKLGHMDKNDFEHCVDNLASLVDLVKTKNQEKVILLGHSMGSFMAQLYITRYHNLDGLILSGSTKASLKMKCGSILASIICAFKKDLSKPSTFMDKMSFSDYNSKYHSIKTKFDWLNRDEEEVKKYILDPYCGWVGTYGFFYNLTHGIKEMGKKRNIKNIDKDLPILIHGGSMDPVSNFKKGLVLLYKQYKKLNMKDVTLIIYPQARHEIYNEINKEEVYQNTLNFIKKIGND